MSSYIRTIHTPQEELSATRGDRIVRAKLQPMRPPLVVLIAGILPNVTSILVTCIVFIFVGLIYRNPDTRATLRRQSLIMLLVVLVVSMFFSISNTLVYLVSRSSPLCSASVNVMIFTGNFQHFIVMLIAINLQLTVVHHVSTAGYIIYYLTGSFIVSLIISLPSAVKHVWGPDPFVAVCWMTVFDPRKRILWTVGTTHIWTLLSAAVALCSSAVVLTKLVVSSRRVKKTFMDSGMNSSILSKQSILSSVTLRILPHPIFLVLSNVVIISSDFYIAANHKGALSLSVITAFVYASPPLFFALVVLFFDPSLSTAIRQLFGKRPTILGVTYTNPHTSFSHTVELRRARPGTSPSTASLGQSDSDVDHGTAQAGPSSKPTLYASGSAEEGLDLGAPDPSHLTSTPGRRLGDVLRTTGTVSVPRTQSHVTTMKNENMDLTTL